MGKSANRLTMHEGRYRFSVAHLLVAIAALFVVLPFVDQLPYGQFIESIVFTLFMLAAVYAVGGRKHTLTAAAVAVVPVLITRWVNHFWPGVLPIELHLIVATVFVAFVIWHLFRFVVKAPQVTSEVLCAAISIYLLFAVAGSFLYTLVAELNPNALQFTNESDANATFAGFNALYFSIQVLTTITFGDILPLSNVARMMALVQATCGVFYLAILVARLVGLYSANPSSNNNSAA